MQVSQVETEGAGRGLGGRQRMIRGVGMGGFRGLIDRSTRLTNFTRNRPPPALLRPSLESP